MGIGEKRGLPAMFLILFIASALFIFPASSYDTEDPAVYIIPSGVNVGPSNPLYGLKLAFEDLDETFTPSDSDRIIKQMENAELRIFEAQAELLDNNIRASEIALERYHEKVNQTIRTAYLLEGQGAGFSEGFIIAERQQQAFEDLISGFSDNRELLISYQNSIRLREIFDGSSAPAYDTIVPGTTATQVITRNTDNEVQKGDRERPGNALDKEHSSGTPTTAETPGQIASTRDTVTKTPATTSLPDDYTNDANTVYIRNSGYSGEAR